MPLMEPDVEFLLLETVMCSCVLVLALLLPPLPDFGRPTFSGARRPLTVPVRAPRPLVRAALDLFWKPLTIIWCWTEPPLAVGACFTAYFSEDPAAEEDAPRWPAIAAAPAFSSPR